ncbi:FAD-dependent oxidoreductase, partial [Sinorhizobium sp. 6-117]|uniref:FAD-dependent oxidoreductase n=1 Tax=Sinorhizobium sp. 6-117 TaxID=3049090 RepID=UPI0024C35037
DLGERGAALGIDGDAPALHLKRAEEVTICYRRGKEHMNASEFEQDLATSKGVTIRHWLQPKRIALKDGRVAGIELDYTTLDNGKLTTTGETGIIAADQIFKAIGQTFEASGLGALQMESGRIAVDAEGRTSLPKVWAGGDCVHGGEDLTVSAVAMGRDAAESINRAFAAAQPLASAVA